MTTPSQSLLERTVSLIERAQQVHFVIPDDTGRFSLEKDLVGKVRELIAETTALLREVTDHYDAVSSGLAEDQAAEESGGLEDIGAQIASELAAQEISGLAYVARSQLVDVGTSLERAVESRSIWKMASEADTALRRTCRALIAAESALREYEGLAQEERQWKNLEDSLEIRRLYSQFQRAILEGGEPTDAELKARLRGAGHRIAILRDLKIYPFLRIDDRLQIRNLQKRIAAWLVGEGDAGEEAGRRLWQDLVSFARLLSQVNNRQELREHDRRTVAELYHALFERGSIPETLPSVYRKPLKSLFGRDDDLDRMILELDQTRPRQLRPVLEKLRQQLERPSAAELGVGSSLVGG